MKTMKKLISLVLALTVVLSCGAMLAGCDGNSGATDPDRFNEAVDTNKTQLYVGYYNGGLGLSWLTEAKRLFEEEYPEYQIMIDTGKDEYLSDVLESNIKTNRQDMYIVDGINYYSFVDDSLLMDITDAVTSPLTEYGEEKSIADKMNISLKGYYETGENKYFAVPYYQSHHHLIYDVDLFDQYSLWFKDGGGFVASASDKKSAGQDGEYGTWDDGLPVTYSDFFAMMDRMVARGITPITWSGQYADAYLTNFIHSMIADYEGDQHNVNWSYDGQLDVITNRDFAESEPKTFSLNEADYETITVTPDNFTEYMHSTVGKYYALKFAKDLSENPLYRTYNYAESHTAVQRSFLMSNMEGVDEPIAMLIEGGWWMNEATSVFTEMAEIDEKYAKENRRFGVMPLPKADDGSSAEGHTVAPFSGGSCVFISQFSTKQDIAVKFFRFLHTEEIMQVFTKYSGCLRPYEYDTNAIRDSVPFYVQNVIDSSEDTTFIFKMPTGEKYKEDDVAINFMQYGGLIYSHIFESTTNNPIIFFCDNAKYTAKDYWQGMENCFHQKLPVNMK